MVNNPLPFLPYTPAPKYGIPIPNKPAPNYQPTPTPSNPHPSPVYRPPSSGGGGGGSSGGGGGGSSSPAPAVNPVVLGSPSNSVALAQEQQKYQNYLKQLKEIKINEINKRQANFNDKWGNVVNINSSPVLVNAYNKERADIINRIADYNETANYKGGDYQVAQGQNNYPTIQSIKNIPSITTPRKETITNLAPKYTAGDYYFEPTIYQKQIGTYKDKNTGQIVPILETRYNAGVRNAPVGDIKGIEDRPATAEEIKYFNQNQPLIASTSSPSVNQRLMNEAYGRIKNDLTNVKLDYFNINEGMKGVVSPVTDILTQREVAGGVAMAFNPVLAFNKELRDRVTNVETGLINDVANNPLKEVALFGLGGVLGAGYKGGAVALKAIPKVGKYLSPTFKVGATGYGVYETAGAVGATAVSVSQAQSTEEAITQSLISAKDLALIGYGFKGGMKGFDIMEGNIKVRGLKELSVKQGEYPTAPIKDQLELFQKNIFKEVSEKPIAFHTTPDIFYKGGIITPKAGTSELPGLYVSTKVSTPFAKITNSNSQSMTSILQNEQALKNAIKDLFAPPKNAGIATLEPLGFREVKAVKVKGGEFPYEFTKPAKQGYMDIPMIKSEIESIARTDAGSYEATGKRFYTKIHGVKVPIDAFKYLDEQINKDIAKATNNMQEAYKRISSNAKAKQELYNPEDYPSYKKPTNEALGLSSISQSIQSSIKSMQSSIAKSISDLYSGKSSNKVSSVDKSYAPSYPSVPDYSYPSSLNYPYSPTSGSAKSSSKGSPSSPNYPIGYSGTSSSVLTPSDIKMLNTPIIFYKQPKQQVNKKQSLGAGYWIYIKQIRSNKFVKVNSYPLTHDRARSVGTYMVDTSVARTFQIKPARLPAQPDYEFIYVPDNYYQTHAGKLRNYRIKNKNPYDLDMERYIEKQAYVGDTQKEIKQLQNFQKNIFR